MVVAPMKRWLAPTALGVGSIVVVVLFVIHGRDHGTPVPDLRGNVPMRSYEDLEWIQPVLDAGFCVDFRYDETATSFERDGYTEVVADSYVVGGEIPDPGSRLPTGSNVTVIVGGSPFGGPTMDWDAVPLICPKDRV